MRNPNKDKVDIQHRRIGVFRTKRNRLTYYHKQQKVAYYIDDSHLRYIQLYFYRYQFALLVSLVSYVISNLWWLAVIVWFVVVGLFELWFRVMIIKDLPVVNDFEHPATGGMIQMALNEPEKIVTMRIFAFAGIVVVSIVAAFFGDYSPAYLIGMLAIGAFALSQVILLTYVQIKRKKDREINNGKK